MRHYSRCLFPCLFVLALLLGSVSPALAQPVASPVGSAVPVVLSSINVVEGVCTDGVFTVGSIAMAEESEGVSYEVVQPDAEGNYSVIAHLQPGYAFPDLTGSPWKLHESIPNALIYAGQLTVTGCEQAPTAQAPPRAWWPRARHSRE